MGGDLLDYDGGVATQVDDEIMSTWDLTVKTLTGICYNVQVPNVRNIGVGRCLLPRGEISSVGKIKFLSKSFNPSL